MLASTLWAQWSGDPSTALTAIAAALWVLGGRGVAAPQNRWRAAAFWGSVATIVVALNSPLDHEADDYFWVHMTQHVLLLTVAPPLLVLSRPMPRMLRALPRPARLVLVRTVRRGRAGAPARWLARPWPAWVAFALAIVLWHIPALYDLALRHQGIHDLEHFTYLASGILFWNHALAAPPFARALSWPARSAYITGAMVVGWVLAVVLALAPHPLYAFYVERLGHLGGLSALNDQRLAAGVMWVPGSVTLTLALILAFYRWLEPSRRHPTATIAVAPPP